MAVTYTSVSVPLSRVLDHREVKVRKPTNRCKWIAVSLNASFEPRIGHVENQLYNYDWTTTYKIKIKFLLFVILARVSDLNVTKNKTALKANTPTHNSGNNAGRPGPSASHATRTLTKNTPGLGGKITKPIRNQKHGERLGRGVRRTTTKTIRNVAQGKRPGRGSGGISSEFVNKWSIISVDMDCLPG